MSNSIGPEGGGSAGHLRDIPRRYSVYRAKCDEGPLTVDPALSTAGHNIRKVIHQLFEAEAGHGRSALEDPKPPTNQALATESLDNQEPKEHGAVESSNARSLPLVPAKGWSEAPSQRQGSASSSTHHQTPERLSPVQPCTPFQAGASMLHQFQSLSKACVSTGSGSWGSPRMTLPAPENSSNSASLHTMDDSSPEGETSCSSSWNFDSEDFSVYSNLAPISPGAASRSTCTSAVMDNWTGTDALAWDEMDSAAASAPRDNADTSGCRQKELLKWAVESSLFVGAVVPFTMAEVAFAEMEGIARQILPPAIISTATNGPAAWVAVKAQKLFRRVEDLAVNTAGSVCGVILSLLDAIDS